MMFAADVMHRPHQYVLVLHETVSSYTLITLIDSEKHGDLHEGIVMLCAEIHCLGDHGAHICIDPAPGLVALVDDALLTQHGISLVVGGVININNKYIVQNT